MCDYTKLTILYGTQLGMSERVALRVARLALNRSATQVSCLPADSIPLHEWVELGHPVIIVCSNSNQGEAPDSIRETWKQMLSHDAPKLDGLHYAIFGVGDSIYDRFNLMAKLMHNRMEQLGATPLLLRGLGDESDAAGMDEQLLPWLRQLWTVLNYTTTSQNATAAETHDTIGGTPTAENELKTNVLQSEERDVLSAPLFPLYTIEFVQMRSDANTLSLSTQSESNEPKSEVLSNDTNTTTTNNNNSSIVSNLENDNGKCNKMDETHLPCNAPNNFTASEIVNEHAYPPRAEEIFVCKVVNNKRLTSEDHFQAVHHLDLIKCHDDNTATPHSPARYEVGDALGVYCPNRVSLVEQLLELCHYNGQELVRLTPSVQHGLQRQIRRPFFNKVMTLRFLLTHYFDLDAVVSQDFLWMLSHYVALTRTSTNNDIVHDNECVAAVSNINNNNHSQEEETRKEVQERLSELAQPSKYQEYLSYAHREKRNVCEVLFDFRQFVHAPLEMILSFTKIMLPRFFSISSSFLYDGPDKFSLTIGLLDWQTPLKRHRRGLCSEYLINLTKGSKVCVFIWEGTLTSPPLPCPLLCISAGTGIAPIRALIRQVMYDVEHTVNSAWVHKPIYVFFGCRYELKDYLYGDEWQTLLQSQILPQLRVIPAFSRDSTTKVYVQHKIGEHAKEIAHIIINDKQLMVYVCGNAKLLVMPVRDVLIDIMVHGVHRGDEQEAMKEMYAITQSGRYQMDTWAV